MGVTTSLNHKQKSKIIMKKIPIEKACLCWSAETKKVGVMEHPIKESLFRNRGFDFDAGASYGCFKKFSNERKMLTLIGDGLYIATNYKIPIQDVVDALAQIDEFDELVGYDPYEA